MFFARLRSLSWLCLFALESLGVASAQEDLAWHFNADGPRAYQLVQKATLDSHSVDQHQSIASVEQHIQFDWQVLAVAPDGSATIAVKIRDYSLHAYGPGGQEVRFDSESDEDPQGFAAMLLPLGKQLSAAQVEFTMTPQGNVTLLELPTDLSAAVKSIPGGKSFAQDGGAASFASLARLGGPVDFPEEMPADGSWQVSIPAAESPVKNFQLVIKYTVTSTDDGVAIIEQKLTATPNADAELQIADQRSSGSIKFDKDAGRPIRSKLTYRAELRGSAKERFSLEHSIELTQMSD